MGLIKMKALSIKQSKAYLAGVVASDGWCKKTFGLRTKDKDFAQAFSDTIYQVYNLKRQPALEGNYWVVRFSNLSKRFGNLETYIPITHDECTAWLRGYFDGDGSAMLRSKKTTPNAYDRRVLFVSTDTKLLDKAMGYLSGIDIDGRVRKWHCGKGHWGKKPMYALLVNGSKQNYETFASKIGSSLARKNKILQEITCSYSNPDKYTRKGQLKGSVTKHQRTMQETLSQVIEGAQQLLAQNIKPTQRRCRKYIPGFNSIQRYISQVDLIAIAKGELALGVFLQKHFKSGR